MTAHSTLSAPELHYPLGRNGNDGNDWTLILIDGLAEAYRIEDQGGARVINIETASDGDGHIITIGDSGTSDPDETRVHGAFRMFKDAGDSFRVLGGIAATDNSTNTIFEIDSSERVVFGTACMGLYTNGTVGTAGQVLTSQGTSAVPQWASAASGNTTGSTSAAADTDVNIFSVAIATSRLMSIECEIFLSNNNTNFGFWKIECAAYRLSVGNITPLYTQVRGTSKDTEYMTAWVEYDTAAQEMQVHVRTSSSGTNYIHWSYRTAQGITNST